MKIVAIEGLDKAGKHTQAKKLKEYLESWNYKVVHSEFHRYDTSTGLLIRRWLTKQYDADQKTIELIMAADKQAQQVWFRELEEKGIDFLILDRYTWSQYAYGCASGSYFLWLTQLLEGVRVPNHVIYIDISAKTSMERKGKHGANDRYESDYAFLDKVRQKYHWLLTEHQYKDFLVTRNSNGRSTRVMINGEQDPDQVAQDIMDYCAFGPRPKN